MQASVNLTDAATVLAWSMVLALTLVSLSGLVVRFRRATGVPRQQLKWFACDSSVA